MRTHALWLAAVGLALGTSPARAQNPAQGAKAEAALVVDGTVREVFRSARRDRVDYLLEVEVKKAELGRSPRNPVRVLVPAPGDALYVHVANPAADAADHATVPGERSQVRVYLAPRASGGWELTSPDGIELTANEPAPTGPTDPPPAASDAAPSRQPAPTGTKAAVPALGLTGEALDVKGRYALRVSSTERGGPAERAGIEPGDVILAANDRELTGTDQLDELARKGGPLNLVVLDVNSGKGVRVPVELGSTGKGPAPAPAGPVPVPSPAPTPAPSPAPSPAPRPGAPKRSLGFSAEPVRLGLRTGMKVLRVDRGSPAQKAGLEPGDVIVAVGDVPVTSVETMSAALRKAGPSPRMTVRDTRTGRDTTIAVNPGSSDAARPTGAPAPAPGAPRAPAPAPTTQGQGGGRRLGVVGEVVFVDVDPAVKVTEVTAGSPAERAGIKPGDVITEANGTAILHPNTLNEVVARSGATLELVLVDPDSSKSRRVSVNLGERR